ELRQTEAFQEFLHREFPVAASELPEGLSRRRWMQLMGASLALGGLSGCRWQEEKIAPFAMRPQNRIPGEVEHFATSIEIAGMPKHLLATCYDGRPIKIEGNPEHLACQGSSDGFSQATILDLYDPDRGDSLLQTQDRQSFRRSWADFSRFAEQHFSAVKSRDGEGFRILVEPTSSLTVHAMLRQVRERFPRAIVHAYSPLARDNETRGTELAFGRALRPQLFLAKAKIIVSFDEDLLGLHPNAQRHAREYAVGRSPGDDMNRLYCVESQFSITGSAADHRLPIKSREIGPFVAHLDELLRKGLGDASAEGVEPPPLAPGAEKFATALVDDLLKNRGKSVLAVGGRQPPEVHAAVHALNALLGNLGQTVAMTADPSRIDEAKSLDELVSDLRDGKVDTLLLAGGNPVYDAPGDLQFSEALDGAATTIRLGVREDETSRRCQWRLPEAHAYEAWGDVRSWDGTICSSQPLIAPLLDGKSLTEVLAIICGDARESQQIVREAMSAAVGGGLEDRQSWERLLHDGFISESGVSAENVTPPKEEDRNEWLRRIAGQADGELELVFTPSDTLLDGRFANNGWLQETPQFLTKLTWDN
ncbi:MAG: TAT-variant-translocated molybdopterin oxidoreductase, partial [Planctomycetota bacterium]